MALGVKTIFIVCGVSVGTLFCAVALGKSLYSLCVGFVLNPCFVLWLLV